MVAFARLRGWLSALVVVLALVLTAPAGPPAAKSAARYSFRLAPPQALTLLSRLERPPQALATPTADEVQLFTSVSDGQELDNGAFADACLLASGVTDPDRLAEYRSQLRRIATAARREVTGPTAADRGEALLKFLHAGPMAKGYAARQTTLSGLLDSGQFNCVSSAVLYAVIARRLGLEVRGVEVPGYLLAGHVFIVLLDRGRRIDVETTNPRGFDPRGLRKRPDGGGYDPAKDPADRREVGEAGLAALIYYNRGVGLRGEKRYLEALRADFSALALDGGSRSAARNAVAEFLLWAEARAAAGEFEEALQILTVALEIAPADSDLKKGRHAAWLEFARSAMKAGHEAEAVAVLRRAAAAVPDSDFPEQQAYLFLRPAEALIKDGKWDAALAVAERGLHTVDAEPARKKLLGWRAEVYLRRAQTEWKKGAFDRAAAVLVKGLEVAPADRDLGNAVLYLAQEWLKAADTSGGPQAAAAALAEMRRQFPAVKDLRDSGTNHVRRVMSGLLKEARYADALATIKRYAPLLEGPEDARTLGAWVYDRRAEDLRMKKDWAGAVAVYAEGLEAYPGEARLRQNAIATYDRWAGKAIDAKDWAEAIRIYQLALAQFPGDSHLADNLAYCEGRLKK
jgi:tetratricopeptide (TPR) repeat protein